MRSFLRSGVPAINELFCRREYWEADTVFELSGTTMIARVYGLQAEAER